MDLAPSSNSTAGPSAGSTSASSAAMMSSYERHAARRRMARESLSQSRDRDRDHRDRETETYPDRGRREREHEHEHELRDSDNRAGMGIDHGRERKRSRDPERDRDHSLYRDHSLSRDRDHDRERGSRSMSEQDDDVERDRAGSSARDMERYYRDRDREVRRPITRVNRMWTAWACADIRCMCTSRPRGVDSRLNPSPPPRLKLTCLERVPPRQDQMYWRRPAAVRAVLGEPRRVCRREAAVKGG